MAAGDQYGRVGLRAVPRPPPTARSAPLLRLALGTWHSLPPESRAAVPAGRSSPRQPEPLRRRRQRHLPRATRTCLSVRGWGGRAGGGKRGGAYSCSRESRCTVHPASAPCYGTLGRTRFIPRKIIARKNGCLAAAPLVARGRKKAAAERTRGGCEHCFRALLCDLSQVVQRRVTASLRRLDTASAQLSSVL